MDAISLLESAVNGMLVGLMYSLVAIGIVLIYKSSSVPNLAQGSMTMLGAYVVLAFANNAGAPIWLAIPLAIATMFVIGIGIERVALRRLAGRPIIMIGPGTGIAPPHAPRLFGRCLRRAVAAGTLITWDMLA